MTDFRIQGGVTWGNIISILTTIVLMVAMYQTVATTAADNAKRLDKAEAAQDQLRTDFNSDRLSNTGILVGLQSDMNYLKAAVDELRRDKRGTP